MVKTTTDLRGPRLAAIASASTRPSSSTNAATAAAYAVEAGRDRPVPLRPAPAEPAGALQRPARRAAPSAWPTLHFLDLLLPHQPWRYLPWRYLPSGAEYNYETFGRACGTSRWWSWGRPRHGLGPGEHHRALGRRNAPNLMWVPQFIKAPDQDSGVVDYRNWEQVDLLPTVADLLHIQVPWRTEGSSQTGRPARRCSEKWWYDIPGRRTAATAPPIGQARLPAPAGATVLVAVNGRIGGASSLFPGRPGEPAVRFAALTPDFPWRPGDGRPQLRLYLLDRSAGRPRLQPVSLSSGWRLPVTRLTDGP